MGKKIDGFVLAVITAAAFYLYFYRAIGNHAAAFILSGICFFLLCKLTKKTAGLIKRNKWFRRRSIRKQTGSTLMKLACEDAADAEESLSTLLEHCYGEKYPLELVQLHPSSLLSAERIFEIWKRHRGEEHLVLCATCKCSTENRILCKTLKQPQLAVLDADTLSQLIAEYPEGILVKEEPHKVRKIRVKRIAALMIHRKNAPRCIVFSFSMLLLYLMSANISYLIAALFLMFVALASLHRASRPAKLF